MELIEEQGLPQRVELAQRIFARRDRPHLRLFQRPLRLPVQPLRSRLARVGAAMQLEVKLAARRRQSAGLRTRRLEEVGRPSQLHTEAVRGIDHLRLRPAPAVAPTKQVEGPVGVGPILEASNAALDLLLLEAPVVRVGGREVREDRGAVDALPEKRVVLRLVGVIPRELLGEEVIAARARHQLRQVAWIAEHVGQPQDFRFVTELVHEKAFAMQQLAHQRLTRREVAVCLDPHRADRFPLAGRDAFLDAAIQVWVGLFHPLVLGRLGCGENIVGVLLHQRQLGRPAARDLPPRLPQRPLPRGIDMGVADGRDAMGAVQAR